MGNDRLTNNQQPDAHHRVVALKAAAKKNKNHQTQLSLLRAVLFLMLLAIVVVATSYGPAYWWAFPFVMAAFLFAIAKHQNAKNRGLELDMLIKINNYEVQPTEQLYLTLPDSYKPTNHVLDLDLVGAKSLMEILNRSTTAVGLQMLLQHLENPSANPSYLRDLQKASEDWMNQTASRQEIMALGLLAKTHFSNAPQLPELPVPNVFEKIARWLFPVFTLLAFVWVTQGAPVLVFFAMVFVNFIVMRRTQKPVVAFGTTLSGAENTFGQYAAIFKIFNGLALESEKLRGLQTTTQTAATALRQLQRLTNFFEQRHNLLVGSLFNALFLYDLQLAIAARKWQEQHAQNLPAWLDAIGQLDYINMLAQWRENHPQFVVPEFVEETKLVAEQLGHPMIANQQVVCNDVAFEIQNQPCVLITGSNMSGKSTFLRSLGVNVVLAQMGAVVYAKKFQAPPFRLLTAIRVSDDLSAGASYFYAELKRLQEIVNALETPMPTLVLLDEILRGTNSEDKYLGSKLLLEKLSQKNALTIVATHDLELSKLADDYPTRFQNWAFESEVKDGVLTFDYRIRRGVAKNRNATFLMQQMGIISEGLPIQAP